MKNTKNTTWKQKLASMQSLKHEIKHTFQNAKKYYHASSHINNRIKERIWDNHKYTTLPKYLQAEISGYVWAYFDMMYEHIEFAHWYDGKFVGKELPYGENFKQELIDCSCFVYKGTQIKY